MLECENGCSELVKKNPLQLWNSRERELRYKKIVGEGKQCGTKAIDGFSVRKFFFRRFFAGSRWLAVRDWGPQRASKVSY